MNSQASAFEKLSKLKVGALFMSMGTGKTKVALDLINSRLHKVDYVLWLCPCSIKNEIENERIKWYPHLVMDIIGVESISQSDRTYLETIEKVKRHKCFMVVDESLKIKNLEAKRTKRILKMGQYAIYKLILNGTPLSKNVLDLYPQMNFLSPKILNMSFNQFRNQYCEYYVRGKLKGIVKAQYNIEHLVSLIKPYIFDSKLEIDSKKNYQKMSYDLENGKAYEKLKEDFLNNCMFDNFNFMALSTLLQKEYCSSCGKQEIVNELIKQINDRVIVFVKFLTSIPKDSHCITGSHKKIERKQIIDDFKDGKFKVLYITYGCGAFGLNLQFCKHIIFSEHTFDYAVREQAEARIYRIGQEYDVTYYDIVCNVGLEKMILKSLDKKVKLLDEVKKEIEKVGVEEWLKTI